MKRRGAALVAEKIAGMSRTEQLEYWRELSRAMLERKESLMAEKEYGGMAEELTIDFEKMQGLGNDYIVIDNLDNRYRRIDFSAFARIHCRRKYSIGADGTLVLCSSENAAFTMIIFNADGGEAEMCGNGIRCAARYYFEKVNGTSIDFSIETAAGIRKVRYLGDDIAINMGMPRFLSGLSESIGEELSIDDQKIIFYRVSMGNPHCVVFRHVFTDTMVRTLGPAIENHERFPDRTNVEFADIVSRNTIKIRVWERGVGETEACGTGAAAVFAAAFRLNLVDSSAKLILEGGVLDFEYSGGDIVMRGGAEYVHHGTIQGDAV